MVRVDMRRRSQTGCPSRSLAIFRTRRSFKTRTNLRSLGNDSVLLNERCWTIPDPLTQLLKKIGIAFGVFDRGAGDCRTA